MSTAITTLKQLFDLFLSDDDLRPAMKYPININKKIYATDAYSIIIIDESNCNFEFENPYSEKYPDVQAVIKEDNIQGCHLLINTEYLDQFKTKDEVILVSDSVLCGKCNGEGKLETDFRYKSTYYSAEFECPVCDGSGVEKDAIYVKNGNKIFDKNNARIKIKDAYLDPVIFNKLLLAQLFLSAPIELLYYAGPHQSLKFKIAYCTFIIMATVVIEEKDFENIINIDFIFKQ